MADADASESMTDTTRNEAGVLENLPRTRPQRSSARRVAARESASANGRPSARGKRSGTTTSTGASSAARGKRRTASAKPAKSGAKAETRHVAAAGGRRPAPIKDSAATAQVRSAGGSPRPSSADRPKQARSLKRPATPRRPGPVEEPAPRQGFECESERAHGPVPPPGGPELVATAAELVGELAKAGVSAGERLLRDAFSRLPGS